MSRGSSEPPKKRLRQSKLNFNNTPKVNTESTLSSRLAGEGLVMQKIPRDGNCLFASIASQLRCYGQSVAASDVRRSLVEHLRVLYSNSESNEKIMLEAEAVDRCGSVETYFSKMSEDGFWGDAIMLSAASSFYERQILLYTDDNNLEQPIYLSDKHFDRDVMRLAFVGKNHYVSIMPQCGVTNSSIVAEQNIACTVSTHQEMTFHVTTESESTQSSVDEKPTLLPKPVIISNNDIGLYVGKQAQSAISDNMKVTLLENHWEPPADFKMPFAIRKVKGKQEKRYLKLDHLKKNPCLAYSPSQQGLFCKPCALFAHASKCAGGQELGFLVIKPLTNYARMFGKDGYVTSHIDLKYHKLSVIRATEFCTRFREKKSVADVIDTARAKQVEENRCRLRPIVKTIILCGHQNLALRGHRDDEAKLRKSFKSLSVAPVTTKGSQANHNHELVKSRCGNFRTLLDFRADSGDVVLAAHLKQAPNNATYISKTVQNSLIASCGNVLREKISANIGKMKFFTILADETTDASRKEQLSISVRYLMQTGSSFIVREDFIGFQTIEDLTGEGISSRILQDVRKLGVDMTYLVGQGYDGASSMSGKMAGTQACIQRQYQHAHYVHCASHVLNLTICKAAEVQAIRNCQAEISAVANFINRSAKRVALLKKEIEKLDCVETRRRRILRLCDTRWVERHDSVLTFKLLFEGIFNCLQECRDLPDAETSSKATMLLQAISQSSFLVSVCVLDRTLSYSLSLSKGLQKVNIDMIEALSAVSDLVDHLKEKRNYAEISFTEIWKNAEMLAKTVDVELILPRLVGKQRHRENVPASTPEEYFRRTIYTPFLDSMILQLESRFADHNKAIYSLSSLIPAFIACRTIDDLKPSLETYAAFIDDVSALAGEFELWKRKWPSVSSHQASKSRHKPAISARRFQTRPSTALASLKACNKTYFPNVHRLLVIASTLPVTTATAERSFSSLKRLKTYLRSTMTDERLNGLALLHVHYAIPIEADEVIDDFVQRNPRRLDFVI